MSVPLIAIDPGALSGAIALFFSDGTASVADIQVVNKQIDAASLYRVIRDFQPLAAVVENVHSMPKQGVASSFKFGMAVGMIHGILAANGIPTNLVEPSVWKRSMGLIGRDKEAARQKAIRLYPTVLGLDLKKDAGKAEALLIGHYWLHFRGNPIVKLWKPTDIDPDEAA